MKKLKLIFLFVSILLPATIIHSQEKKLNRAGRDYENYNYVNAKKIYLKVAERGYESEEVFTKLANTYYFNAQYDEAAKWYKKLFELNENPKDNLLLLRFSQSLQAMGESARAKEYYSKFIELTAIHPKNEPSIDYPALIEANSGRYEFKEVAGLKNDKQISYGHTVYDNKLVFASTAEEPKTFRNTRDAWAGLSFLSLYEAEIDDEGQIEGKHRKITDLESKFHESSAVFTKDGNTMYFTRTNPSKNKKNTGILKIYRSVRVDGKWQEPEELSINSDSYSTAHPTLNADETRMYFASDRPGGLGQTDLYVSEISSDGTLGTPVNLGPKINTPGKETFPFISKENELYFSSDGHFGLGGLDVFYVKIQDDNFGPLLNVGEPVNSYADDFAFGIDTDSKRGFVSSNRTNKKGSFVYDNIYTFLEHTPIRKVFSGIVEGVVIDIHSEEPLEGIEVTFFNPREEAEVVAITDEKGHYTAEINKFLTYTVRTENEDFDTDEKLTTPNLDHQRVDFELQRDKQALKSGTNLADVLNIPIIYFDFDKSNIREDARVELEKLFTVMEDYPELRINIRSHTDSRGSDEYNLKLSQRRAKSTLEYLVSKGIDRNRLQSEGLGETELVNNCSNDVPCSEEEHQKNRRSEFVIL